MKPFLAQYTHDTCFSDKTIMFAKDVSVISKKGEGGPEEQNSFTVYKFEIT